MNHFRPFVPWHTSIDGEWSLSTSRIDASGIWTRLSPHIDPNDRVLIIGVTRDFSGWLPQEAWNWINARARATA